MGASTDARPCLPLYLAFTVTGRPPARDLGTSMCSARPTAAQTTTWSSSVPGAAGAATAMLLARAGHDVVVVDRAQLPSDTTSTHSLVRGGVVQLSRWGLLDEVLRQRRTPRSARCCSTSTATGRPHPSACPSRTRPAST